MSEIGNGTMDFSILRNGLSDYRRIFHYMRKMYIFGWTLTQARFRMDISLPLAVFFMLESPRNLRSIETRLRKAGVVFDRLEDVPPKVVREVNRRDFPDMRSIELPANVIRSSLRQPLLGELLVTRIGYHGRGLGIISRAPKEAWTTS